MSDFVKLDDLETSLAEVSSTDPAPGPNPAEWGEKTDYQYEEVGDRNWDGNARVYEWDGDEGDIGPEYPELEVVLFGEPDQRNPEGLNLEG